MMTLEEIKRDNDLVNEIDWEMTPEEAVVLYLEWGNNWSHGKMIRSKNDASYYFIVYNWDEEPVIYLIRRNSEEARELACFTMPENVREEFLNSVPHRKGVYPVRGVVKEWLKGKL